MKIIIFLFAFLAANVNATTSLRKPISVILSDSEVAEYESIIRKGNFDSNDFKNALVFEGVLIDIKIKGDGENAYTFNVKKTLKFSSSKKIFHNKQVSLVAPSKPDKGGLELKIGKPYRVCAPMLPDGRYAIWKGTIIELSSL